MVYVVSEHRSAEQCVWRNRFSSQLDISEAGGTLYNSPTFATGGGLVLNGTNQYAAFPCDSLFGNLTSLTIKVVFTPDFDTDDNKYSYFFDTSPDFRYRCMKGSNAPNNVLYLFMNGTQIGTVPEATYSPYWNVGQKNTLIISSSSGATDIYLNNNLIMDNDNTAWSVGYPSNIYVGANYVGVDTNYDGTIHEFSAYQGKWTAEDVDNDYLGRQWNYPNRAKCWFDMSDRLVSGSGHITTDKSASGYHLTLGDGGGDEEPDFLKPGYEFDGVVEHAYSTSISGLFNSTELSIAFAFGPDFKTDYDAAQYFFDTNNDNRYRMYKSNNVGGNIVPLMINNSWIISLAETDYSPYWKVEGVNVFIVCSKSGLTEIYFNGHMVGSDTDAITAGNPTELYLASTNTGAGSLYDGNIYFFGVWHEKLSSQQVRDLNLLLQNKYH